MTTPGQDEARSWDWWAGEQRPPADPTAEPLPDSPAYARPRHAQPLFGQPPPEPPPTEADQDGDAEPAHRTHSLSAAETAVIPKVAYYETVIIPKVREQPPEAPPSLPELAQRYGLRPAAKRPRLRSYLADLWRYREFIATYAEGRTVAQFGEARLGRVWQVLTPLVNAAIYFLIFGVILGTRHGVHNFIGYLTVGVFMFNYTSNVVSSTVSSISGQLGLVRALRFPRASLPVAMLLMQLQNLLISTVVMIGVVLATREPLNIQWLWLPVALVLLTLFNLGLGLAAARLGAKVTDVRHILPYVLRVWMYISGVLYNVDVFTEQLPSWATPILHANPMLVYIELCRYAIMEQVPLASSLPRLLIMASAWAIIAVVGGLIYFWRGEREYGRG